MVMPSPPIDIVAPSRLSSSSPRNQSSNLTSALHNASTTAGMDIPGPMQSQPRQAAPRQQESAGLAIPQSGAKSISQSANRRGSNTGSFMGGMSWGGVSVGSWLQDDIMMTGTSPLNTTMQSPSLHSSSYLPKMEANFWNNLRCCDTGFSDLHELLQHYEEAHASAQNTFPHRMSLSRSFRRKGSFMSSSNQPQPATQQIRGFQPFQEPDISSAFGRTNPPAQDPSRQPFSAAPDMDTIGEMEMDESQDQFMSPEQAPTFPSSRPSPINAAIANVKQSEHGAQSSNPSTPTAAHPSNPMVSSVNTPTFASTTATQSTSTSPGIMLGHDAVSPTTSAFNPQLLSNLNSGLSNLDFNDNGDMTDLCINDPARALFSNNGRINPQQASHFGFANGASSAAERPGGMTPPRLAAARAMLPSEDDRPYKCKVIGCEKAYKNSNGLRYHERHGHSGQKLRENDDGSRSIVDPETNEPYPGTLGMEKEKPYSCDVCLKRYKNLNGLKYHRNHSAPCNPEVNGGLANLTLSQPAQPQMGMGTGPELMF